jgi:GxxExxY protein
LVFSSGSLEFRGVTSFASGQGMTNDANFAHGELTGRIIQGFLQTHSELGSGFSEKVCGRALAIVLAEKGLRVWTCVPIKVLFHTKIIGEFVADMVVDDTVLIEIKAGPSLDGYPQAQLLNYLKGVGGGVGLLLNFGRRPEYKRMVMGDPFNSLPTLRRTQQSSMTR